MASSKAGSESGGSGKQKGQASVRGQEKGTPEKKTPKSKSVSAMSGLAAKQKKVESSSEKTPKKKEESMEDLQLAMLLHQELNSSRRRGRRDSDNKKARLF